MINLIRKINTKENQGITPQSQIAQILQKRKNPGTRKSQKAGRRIGRKTDQETETTDAEIRRTGTRVRR